MQRVGLDCCLWKGLRDVYRIWGSFWWTEFVGGVLGQSKLKKDKQYSGPNDRSLSWCVCKKDSWKDSYKDLRFGDLLGTEFVGVCREVDVMILRTLWTSKTGLWVCVWTEMTLCGISEIQRLDLCVQTRVPDKESQRDLGFEGSFGDLSLWRFVMKLM